MLVTFERLGYLQRIESSGRFVAGLNLIRIATVASHGIANVRIEVVHTPDNVPPAVFAVQIGAFRDPQSAERVRAQMAARYGTARLVERSEKPGVWRVMVGAEPTPDAARALSSRIRKESGERNAFVVRLDSE